MVTAREATPKFFQDLLFKNKREGLDFVKNTLKKDISTYPSLNSLKKDIYNAKPASEKRKILASDVRKNQRDIKRLYNQFIDIKEEAIGKKFDISFTIYKVAQNKKRAVDPHYDSKKTMFTKFFNLTLTIKESTKKKVLSLVPLKTFINKNDHKKKLYKCFDLLSKDDEEFDEMISNYRAYYEGLKIHSVTETIDNNVAPQDIQNDWLDGVIYMNDSQHTTIYSNFIQNEKNENATSMKDLFDVEKNQYIKENFKPNSCVLTTIINKFYNNFDKKDSKGYRKTKEMNYKNLCDVLGIEYKEKGDMGITIRESLKFFEKYRYGLDVYDCFMNKIFSYKPNVSYYPKTLKIMIKDEHIYELNDNIPSLSHIDTEESDELKEIIVSKYYHVQKFDEEDDNNKLFYVESYDEIFKILNELEVTEFTKVKFIYNNSLTDLFIKLYNDGHIPKIFYDHEIYIMSFKPCENLYVSIEYPSTNMDDSAVAVEHINEYKMYQNAFKKCYTQIIKNEYVSDHHESVIKVEDTYSINPICGYFDEKHKELDETFYGIDERKAYSECLMSIEEIPVFNYFDTYKEYNDEEIDDLSYYIIDVEDNEFSKILFKEKYCRTMGFVLKQIKGLISFNIHYVRKALNKVIVDFKKPVEEVYENDSLDITLKKHIVNKITGMLEMKYNKKSITKVFESINDARYYQIKYSDNLFKSKIFTCDLNEENELYIINIFKKERLCQNLQPIKDMIYCRQALKILERYQKMKNIDCIEIVGIHTDSILYDVIEFMKVPHEEYIAKYFDLSDKVGCFKIEYSKSLVNTLFEIEENELIDIDQYEPNIIELQDEYNIEEAKKFIDQKRIVAIKANYPGCGKSEICKRYDPKALFILPYNELCLNYKNEGFEAVTFDSLFGLICGEKKSDYIKQKDISEYNTIIFDEIFIYTPYKMKKIQNMILQNPNKVFICTGDTHQRDPVGFSNSEYLSNCVNIMFRNQINLKIIKRVQTEEDRIKIMNLKSDIFNLDLKIEDVLRKYDFKFVKFDEVTTLKNITYFRRKCDEVNNRIHYDILKHKEKWFDGLKIKCREHHTDLKQKFKLIVNYVYTIKKYNEKEGFVIIRDDFEERDYAITTSILEKKFKYTHSSTCDSMQGVSLGENDKVTIYNINNIYADRKYAWTAITRARKLENVQVCLDEANVLKSCMVSKLILYFTMKIDNYKNQDKRKNRTWKDDDYIDDNWINEKRRECKMMCCMCQRTMNIGFDKENKVFSDITVDRIDNSKPHIKSNCRLACLKCNITKH